MERKEARSRHKTGNFVVIAAELVPEAEEEDDDHLLGEIREKAAIPWVKKVLKVGIRSHMRVPIEE